MPFKSAKQKKLMQIVAHDPEFAEKVHIEQKVAKKLIKDDEEAKKKAKEKADKKK
jgi:hypothetical protein